MGQFLHPVATGMSKRLVTRSPVSFFFLPPLAGMHGPLSAWFRRRNSRWREVTAEFRSARLNGYFAPTVIGSTCVTSNMR